MTTQARGDEMKLKDFPLFYMAEGVNYSPKPDKKISVVFKGRMKRVAVKVVSNE